MAPEKPKGRGTQLFTVRLWFEDMGDGATEGRGQVRHVLSGASLHFRDWEQLRCWMESAFERYQATVD